MQQELTRLSRQQTGRMAEHAACRYLKCNGLELIEKNYACPMGEIDLIMKDSDTCVFVEVRYRRHDSFGGGLASVTYKKQQRITRTAAAYLQSRGSYGEVACRFDVVSVSGKLYQDKINHLRIDWVQDAFQSRQY